MVRTGHRFTLILFLFAAVALAQPFSRTLLRADKQYIRQSYRNAIRWYDRYLKRHPRDYYASRQAAICYSRLNDPSMAIDYWPAVIENAEANDQDLLDYCKCLLANYRKEEAARVLVMLSRSADASVAAWARAYANPDLFFADSSLTRVVEVSGINTPAHENAPVLLNGRLFYLSDPSHSPRVFTPVTDDKIVNIHVALQRDSAGFSSDVSYNDFTPRNVNGQFCFSPDGSTIWFTMAVYSKDMGVRTRYPYYRYQLYSANMTGPTEIKAFRHNSIHYNSMHPALSPDGQHLYFASDGKGTLGGLDLFVCDLVNGEWTEPRNLGSKINSPGNEVFPRLADDGFLYFSSDHLPGLGGLDIFYARPVENGGFETARNCGAWINSQFDDFGLWLLPGGKSGYLSSKRKNNTDDDIYYFRNDKTR